MPISLLAFCVELVLISMVAFCVELTRFKNEKEAKSDELFVFDVNFSLGGTFSFLLLPAVNIHDEPHECNNNIKFKLTFTIEFFHRLT